MIAPAGVTVETRVPSRLAAPERPSGPCRRRRKSPCGLKPLSQHSPDSAALQGQDHLLVRLGQRQILLRVRAGGKKPRVDAAEAPRRATLPSSGPTPAVAVCQTTGNQRLTLQAAAARRGWTIAATHEDAGISGAKGRGKRPGLAALLKDTMRGKYDILMARAVDRLGRSLSDLVDNLQELQGARADLFLYQQAVDTTTLPVAPCGVFAEFEHAMIQVRLKADPARGRGVRPPAPTCRAHRGGIQARLATGAGILRWPGRARGRVNGSAGQGRDCVTGCLITSVGRKTGSLVNAPWAMLGPGLIVAGARHRSGERHCSSSHASALFRAFYPCEYALRPDREDIIR